MRKRYIPNIIIVLLFCTSGFVTSAQTIDSLLDDYTANAKQERLYLHYDKSIYSAGDTIWFKAYLMTELYPSEESKTIYVDWLDAKGTVLSHTLAPVVEASSTGQFAVPETYTGSAVQVRAYTRWMLNFDTSFVYNKQLRVLPATAPATVKTKPVTSIQFLPEGGDAIADLKTKIVFKATDQWGQPVKVSGTIHDAAGTEIQAFKSTHNGMGYFFLIPKAGVTYSAKWKDEFGVQHTTPLPQVKPSGISLSITVSGTKRIVTLNRTETAGAQFNQLHLVGTMFQNKVFSTRADLSTKTSDSKVIPTVALPTGILTITVFDAANNAIAERITYVKNDLYFFQPTLNVLRYGLSKRAKNDWEIKVPDSLVTSLSIAVTDAEIGSDSSENIYSHLLLTSDLKGQVYKPAAYFSGNHDSTSQQLDLVMLTNGWRRFKWEDVVSGKRLAIKQSRDTSYVSFSGKLYGIQSGRLSNENLIAIVKTKDSAASQMMVVPINANGYFDQPDFVFFDTLQVYYQFKKGSLLSNASVRFMENRLGAIAINQSYLTPAGNSFSDTTGLSYHLATAREKREMKDFLSAKTLSTVTVRSRVKSKFEEMDKRYASGLFSGADSYQFDLTDDKTAMGSLNVFQYLQGKVAGLQISNSGGNTTMQWRGGTPSVYLNEMPTDVDMLSSVSVADIAYIKVFRPPFMGGFNGAGGAIAIYTKKGGDTKSTSKGLDNTTITGYTPIRQFYSPNYGTFDARHEQRDLRTTLYWNPFITTNEKKNSFKLSFYNNDVTKAFRVIVEGVTKDGQLTHFETIVE